MEYRKLFAGPYVGELGWLLFCFQGYIRKKSRNFNETIFSTRSGLEYIVKDFAKTFVPVVANGPTDCMHCYGYVYNNIHEEYIDISKGDVWQPAIQIYYNNEANDKEWDRSNQEFIKYGTYDSNLKYDILIHSRSTSKCNTKYRNWNINNWVEIVNKFNGLKIGCIGSKNGSAYVPGTIDLRSDDIEFLSNCFASSTLVVGASSGPMHLASLCGTRHIVITYDGNISRYEHDWNPFNTPCDFVVNKDWNPSIDEVYSVIKKYI